MGDLFRSKLARLRRDGETLRAGSQPAVGTTSEQVGGLSEQDQAGLPGWAKDRMAQRAGHAQRAGSDAPVSALQAAGGQPSHSSCCAWTPTVGDPGDLIEGARREGTYVARVQRFGACGLEHGDWRFSELDHADGASIARLAKDDALAGLDLRRAVYLDTETTGLSGGAGVYVFMVGLGWFEGDEYVSWQGFLRHPGDERALLAEVADRVAASTGLVSFFGKSFDRHRLQDKMCISGVTPPFEGLPHLDLYHPFRRLTHGALENGKLQTMERELLGFHRTRDLPGSLAPAAWFDYLASRPHLLEGVFQHNHEDVLSLVALTAYLGRATVERRVSGAPLVGPDAHRALAMADTATGAGERLAWAERALERGLDGTPARRLELLRADLLRRAGRVAEARAAYRAALEACADDLAAVDLFVGASMLLERQLDDLESAHRMAERALETALGLRRPKGQLGTLVARVQRLRARMIKADSGPPAGEAGAVTRS